MVAACVTRAVDRGVEGVGGFRMRRVREDRTEKMPEKSLERPGCGEGRGGAF